MKTGDLAQQYGVSNETIRRWVAEFHEYLSDNAKKKSGRQSIFDAKDYIVMSTIAELSLKKKFSFTAIHAQLASGYRIEDVSTATIGYSDGRTVPAAAVEQIIDSTELRVELEQIKYERDQLLRRIEQMEQREEKRDSEFRALQESLAELQHRLGLAEGELNYRRILDEKNEN